MSVDNIFWISTSPEYNQFKRLGFFKKNDLRLAVEGRIYSSKIQYILIYRVGSVLTHWRDIVPALITSTILTIVLKSF